MPGAGNHCQQSLKQLGCRRDGGPKTGIGLLIYFEMWWDQPGNRFSSRTRCSSCKRRCEKSSAAGSWCDISSFAILGIANSQTVLSGIAWYSHWIVAFALELGTQSSATRPLSVESMHIARIWHSRNGARFAACPLDWGGRDLFVAHSLKSLSDGAVTLTRQENSCDRFSELEAFLNASLWGFEVSKHNSQSRKATYGTVSVGKLECSDQERLRSKIEHNTRSAEASLARASQTLITDR